MEKETPWTQEVPSLISRLDQVLQNKTDEGAEETSQLLQQAKVALESLYSKVQELQRENERLKQREEEQDEELFQIDTNPVDEEESRDKITYVAATVGSLKEGGKEDGKDKESSPKPKPGPANTCFNCGGDHMIADCPKPKDFAAIARRKKEFQRSQAAFSNVRYHVDEEQRFAHLKPGVEVSERLRRAMGLRENQLPSYVYRMREMGYPPGWLREAEVHHSGVALYIAEGKALGDMDEEEGEMREDSEKTRYDIDKLVAWPGFNEEMPEGFRDEARSSGRGWPPQMRQEQSIDAMRRELGGDRAHTAYVRGDMQDTSVKRQGKEAQKEDVEMEEEEEKKVEVDPDLTGALRSDEVKIVNEGTPIVSTYSPFGSLPEQNAWAQGTTDHILFENLPDSTGKWDQMCQVLKKGRKMRENLKNIDKAENENEEEENQESEEAV